MPDRFPPFAATEDGIASGGTSLPVEVDYDRFSAVYFPHLPEKLRRSGSWLRFGSCLGSSVFDICVVHTVLLSALMLQKAFNMKPPLIFG
jgi:hypothetical protein